MHVDRAGRFWVATRDAVFRRAGPGERFEQVDVIGLSSNFWQAFSEDEDGNVWFSDFRQGFRRVGDRGPVSEQQRGWGVQLLHDRRRNLWVATRGQGLGGTKQRPRGCDSARRHHGEGRVGKQRGSVCARGPGRQHLGWDTRRPAAVDSAQGDAAHRSADCASRVVDAGWLGGGGRQHGGVDQDSWAAGRRSVPGAAGPPRHRGACRVHRSRGAVWVATERALARFADGTSPHPRAPS